MAEKVKVSREVAEQIELGVELHHGEGNFLEHHAEMVGRWRGNTAVLNGITTWKMAQILIKGYEIEGTPEEKILEKFNKALKSSANLTETDYGRWFNQGFVNGVTFVLSELKIEIEGINNKENTG